jgi:hypothetical protein
MTKNKSGQLKNINNTQTSSVANNMVTTDKKPSKKKRKKTELSDSSVSQPNSNIDNTSLNANANEPESITKVQIKSNQNNLFKVGTFYDNQHKLSRAFQTDMHNKLHKLNTAQ